MRRFSTRPQRMSTSSFLLVEQSVRLRGDVETISLNIWMSRDLVLGIHWKLFTNGTHRIARKFRSSSRRKRHDGLNGFLPSPTLKQPKFLLAWKLFNQCIPLVLVTRFWTTFTCCPASLAVFLWLVLSCTVLLRRLLVHLLKAQH